MYFKEERDYLDGLTKIFQEPDKNKLHLNLKELVDITNYTEAPEEHEFFLSLYNHTKEIHLPLTLDQIPSCHALKIVFDTELIVADGVLISYCGNKNNIEIPALIGDIKIKRIGAGALYHTKEVSFITVETGIETIGAEAFGNYNEISRVSLPETIKNIDPTAFMNTQVMNFDFYMCVPYEKYMCIRDAGLELVDGKILFDPMILGEQNKRRLVDITKGYMGGRFLIDKRMGYLFFEERYLSHVVQDTTLVFKDFGEKYGIIPERIKDKTVLFKNRIKTGDYDFWFEHDEECDDSKIWGGISPMSMQIALLFLVETGSVSDAGINLCLAIRSGKCHFQRGVRVNNGEKDYVVMLDEYITRNDKIPFARSHMTAKTYDLEGNEINKNDVGNALEKYKFLNDLI